MRATFRACMGPGWTGSLCLLVIVITGAVLRGFWLGRWSLDGDEWYTYEHALAIGNVPFSELKSSVRTYPGIYVLTRLAMILFGESPLVLRLFPCLIGAVAVPVFYRLAAPLTGRGGALLGALFLALSPWLIFHSQQARFYMGAFLFGMMAVLIFYRGIAGNRGPWSWWGMVCFVIACMFHPSSVMILPGLVVSMLVARRVDPAVPPPGWRCWAPLLLALLLGGIGLFINFASIHNTILANLALSHSWSYSAGHLLSALAYNFGVHLLPLAAYGLYVLWKENRVLAAHLLSVLGIYLIFLISLALLEKQSGQRYLLPVMVCVYLPAGFGGYALLSGALRKEKLLAAVVVIAFLVPGMPSLVSYYQDGNRFDLKSASDYVGARLAPRDRVFAQTHAIFSYYLRLNHQARLDDSAVGKPVVETSLDLTGDRLDHLVKSASRVWVVVPEKRLEGDGFYADDFKAFVRNRCRLVTKISKPRFDYHRNVLKIYLSQEGGR